jgi:hypothetical protein
VAWRETWWLFGAASAVLLLAAIMQRRRGLGGLALLPWDYIALTAGIGWIAALAHLLTLLKS